MKDEPRILQIMPADGWVAEYKDGESGEPVLCFALVEFEEDGVKFQEVRPMCPDSSGIAFVDNASNFRTVRKSVA